ncbi:MAG: hypothetical protein ABI968_07955 [Acidobacteriota bacterium]
MRLVPFGTPSKTNKYVFPTGRLGLFGVSLVAGLALLLLLTGTFWGGAKTIASPGKLSSSHQAVEKKCATCHAPAATEVRCEYCHDPFGTSRFENAGHVWFGTKDPQLVARAKTIECATCHTDHQGRDYPMRRVDERDCASCHFRSMAQHPEIALVKARVSPNEGILFTHKRHVQEMKKANLESCQFCHEPTGDRRGFEAISFDRHCARCHLPGGFIGKTDPMPRAAVILPDELDVPWAAQLVASTSKLPRERVEVANLRHRDPWVLYNLWKLSREVDPAGVASKRQVIVQRIEDLNFQLRQPPTKGLALATLRQQESTLLAHAKALSQDSAKLPERRRAEKALARVRVQIELGPLQMTAPRSLGRAELLRKLSEAKAGLADFDNYAGGAAPTLSDAERQARLAAATALTSSCAKCHIYKGPLMAPVQAAMPVLDHAQFNHLPHVEQLRRCQTCHTTVEASNKAEEVNLPGIANCQSCHRPGESRSDCGHCHYYHPPKEPWPPI